MAVLGLPCLKGTFSSCSERGLLLNCGARTSHCSGFSGCRAQVLELSLSTCVLQAFVSPWHVGSSRTRGETRVTVHWQAHSEPPGPPGKSPSLLSYRWVYFPFVRWWAWRSCGYRSPSTAVFHDVYGGRTVHVFFPTPSRSWNCSSTWTSPTSAEKPTVSSPATVIILKSVGINLTWRSNKDLLFSTGNSAQYSVITWWSPGGRVGEG